jgi:hypothetical protein
MYAPNLPEPWAIAEVERHRRSESHRDDRPSLELPLPPPPRQDAPGTGTGRTVVVIDMCGDGRGRDEAGTEAGVVQMLGEGDQWGHRLPPFVVE